MAIYDYRKHFKGNLLCGVETRGCKIEYGEYAIAADSYARVTEKQIESLRCSINRELKGLGKLFIRIFPNRVVTKKPKDTRMGSGKGGPDHKIFAIRPGRVIIEITEIPIEKAKSILLSAAAKLSCNVKFIQKGRFQ